MNQQKIDDTRRLVEELKFAAQMQEVKDDGVDHRGCLEGMAAHCIEVLLEVVADQKKEIDFWAGATSNVAAENRQLLKQLSEVR